MRFVNVWLIPFVPSASSVTPSRQNSYITAREMEHKVRKAGWRKVNNAWFWRHYNDVSLDRAYSITMDRDLIA